MAGIYIHIPFCSQACHYCDFHFTTNLGQSEALLGAIKGELLLRNNFLQGQSIETVYLGGGTPSLLSPKQLETLFQTIHDLFDTRNLKEVTIEANPDDINDPYLISLKPLGVTRLSLGVQSFHDDTLRFLNRSHSAYNAKVALEKILDQTEFDVSADLIFNIPGFGRKSLQTDLDTLLNFGLPHISIYALTIEEKTVFGHRLRKKELAQMPEYEASEEFTYIIDYLEERGFEQYEISNFAKNEKYGMHNTNYWLGRPYLGIGPSAHSFDGQKRYVTIANNAKYISTIREGKLPLDVEDLSPENRINEIILTNLRTKWGLSIDIFSLPIFEKSETSHLSLLKEFQSSGLVKQEEGRLYLTKKGRLLADEIAMRLFV